MPSQTISGTRAAIAGRAGKACGFLMLRRISGSRTCSSEEWRRNRKMSNETSDEPLRLGELDARSTLDRIAAGLSDRGVAQYEIYLLGTGSLEVEMEKGSLKSAQAKRETGFSVRVALDGGRVGFSYNDVLSPEAIEATIRRAIAIASAATPDADFKAFADASAISYLPRDLVFDPAIERLGVEDG